MIYNIPLNWAKAYYSLNTLFCMSSPRGEIKRAVDESLEELLDKDEELLIHNANERSISHRLAMYLEQKVRDFETDYDVDVEYNRVIGENGETEDIRDSKRVKYDEFSSECRGRKITDGDTNAQTVFPDIIVHRRGSNEYNLLVIEVKKTSSSYSEKCDKEKIERYRCDLGYENGLFLRLKVGDEPNIADCDWYPE